MYSYVCVLSTDDYLEGILTLSYNLRVLGSKYSLLCLINEKISEKTKNILDYFNIHYKVVPSITYDNGTDSRWNNTFDKVSIFNLTEYEKIVYLDSDLLILKNLDHLFTKENFTMASDESYSDKYNSGIMVLKPNQSNYEGILKIVREYEARKLDGVGDQNAIIKFFENSTIEKLDIAYNQMKIVRPKEDNTIGLSEKTPNVSNPIIIHFILHPKPFMLDKKYDLNSNYWTKIYNTLLSNVRNKVLEYENEKKN